MDAGPVLQLGLLQACTGFMALVHADIQSYTDEATNTRCMQR